MDSKRSDVLVDAARATRTGEKMRLTLLPGRGGVWVAVRGSTIVLLRKGDVGEYTQEQTQGGVVSSVTPD